MDGDNWKVIEQQSSEDESFGKNNRLICEYHEQEVNDAENENVPQAASNTELAAAKSSDESLSASKSRIKFPYGKARIIGKSSSGVRVVKNVYITTCKSGNDDRTNLNANALEKVMESVIEGKVVVRETSHGIILAFTREQDCEIVTGLNMSGIFGTPIVLWNIPQAPAKHQNVIIIREIPWCVSMREIEGLLKCQGIFPAHITRGDGAAVRVVVRSCSALDKFLQEGFNFFDCVTLPVVMEPSEDADLIQCYKCQRFWHTAAHCRFHIRCVRCGEKHDVRDCQRSRKNALCCLCGQNHHAAYKLCPVRVQHLNSVQIDFAMLKDVQPV